MKITDWFCIFIGIIMFGVVGCVATVVIHFIAKFW